MHALIRRPQPNSTALAIAQRVHGFERAMLDTLDQMLLHSQAAPYHLRFRHYAFVGGAYLVFWVDPERLYHLPLTRLIDKSITERLTLIARRPVSAILDPRYGLFYAISLRPLSTQQRQAPLPTTIPLDLGSRPGGDVYIPIGVESGPLWYPAKALGHILVGGATGAGKSNYIQSVLLSLTDYPPALVQLMLIDPKEVEFHFYRRCPHLVGDVATDIESATRTVQALIEEVNRRLNVLKSAGRRDVSSYNQTAAEPLSDLFVVVDEFLDLALAGGTRSEFYSLLIRNANRARAAGVHFILGATNPKAEIMNTALRSACQTRICFRVIEDTQSEVILEARGAETLPKSAPGRMLARLPDRDGLVMAQAFSVSDDVLNITARKWTARPAPVSTSTTPTPQLSAVERDMVLYALRSCGGMFRLRDIKAQFRGKVTSSQVDALGRQWESRGWLLPPASVTASRQIAQPLREIVGWPSLPPTP